MPGIEFVGDDGGDHPDVDEDLVDGPGPRRPWPRWAWLVAGLLAVAVVAGAVVASRSDDTPDASTSGSPVPSIALGSPVPSTAGRQSLSGAPTPAAPDDDGVPPQISVLTADGTSLFWVAGPRLYRAGPVGRASTSVAITAGADGFTELQLVPDPADRTIWVVSRGSGDSVTAPGVAEGYSVADLSRVTRVAAPSLIEGAAVLDGALYVLSDERLLRVRPGGSGFTSVAAVGGHASDLVAVGDGLLFVEAGNGSAVGRWTAADGVAPAIVLDTIDSTLVVAGSTVFVIGTRGGRDVIGILTPTGRVADRGSDIGLTSVQPVAAGKAALLVLGMARLGLTLGCVTVTGGRADLRATRGVVSANVAVLRGVIFQAVGSTVAPVAFPAGSCPA